MALRGPAAKANKHGRGAAADWTDVPAVAYTGASPDLPRLPGRKKWSELTLQWWDQVRAMPHCGLWEPTDWTFAIETALLKEMFWRQYDDGEAKSTMATEIRRREAAMGTTAEARRQLRIRYVPVNDTADLPEPDTDVVVVEQATAAGAGVATVTSIADRQARLTRSA